ncbi:MAG: thioesterase [Nocardioides sp.]|nr:thioesterase [Nocardioides sp.]
MSDGRATVRTLVHDPRPDLRVLALPHSGGRAESFECWVDHLAGRPLGHRVELCAVQYPGHGDRLSEEPVGDVTALAEQIVPELAAMTSAELVIIGHSFGSVVACEVARGCELAGIQVALVAVSSAWAPGDPARPLRREHLLPAEDLWQRLVALGGIDPEIAQEPEMRDLLLPALRCDITAHERYLACPSLELLSCDLHAYQTDRDPLVPGWAGSSWARMTTGRATASVRPGGHFHVFDEPAALLRDLMGRVVGGRRQQVWPA